MNNAITAELYWLLLTIIMTAIIWVPVILNRIFETGVWATLKPPQLIPKALWAERLVRGHSNAVENLIIFAPLVLAIMLTNTSTSVTITACMVYFFARLVHLFAYVLAIPVVRTLAFVAGFSSQMILAITLLQAL